MAETKYRVYKQNLCTSEKFYKRYKTIDGWTRDSRICWLFSRQGALNIQDRINHSYKMYNVCGWSAGIEVDS